jgi:hypothetical protein
LGAVFTIKKRTAAWLMLLIRLLAHRRAIYSKDTPSSQLLPTTRSTPSFVRRGYALHITSRMRVEA